MKYSLRERTRLLWLVFFASLLSFWLYNLSRSFFFTNEALYYTVTALSEIISTLIPAFIAVMLLFYSNREGYAMRLLSALKLNLPRLAYLIPFYYLYYMDQGFDSLESLALLSIHSLFMLAVFILEVYLYALAAKFLLERREKRHGQAVGMLEAASPLDFSSPSVYSFFAISLMRFIVSLATEIYDAAYYLIEYAGGYRISEITYMLMRFVFVFAMLFISHLLLHFSKYAFFVKKEEA